jgi:hypothetical protein
MLDRLVAHGTLTSAQRATIAADDGMVSPHPRCGRPRSPATTRTKSCVTRSPSRDLGDARSLASVLHHRISCTVCAAPPVIYAPQP